jgi:lipoate-protein ligase B
MSLQDHNGRCVHGDLGVVPIPVIEELMSEAVALRAHDDIPDLLLFMAHPPTVALGLRGRRGGTPADLLVSPEKLVHEGIALTRSIRGGGITYHWPGQVVCYPILALGVEEQDVTSYMFKLEQVGMQALRALGVEAYRRRESAAHVGLWVVGERKIMSAGVRISNWITSFGFALNLEGDYSRSKYVRPCGIEGACFSTVEELLGSAPPRDQVVEEIKSNFASIFDRNLVPIKSARASEVDFLVKKFCCG